MVNSIFIFILMIRSTEIVIALNFIEVTRNWEPHEKLPTCSLRTMLTRFLDITTPPTRQLLTLLAAFCEDKDDQEKLNILANVT